MSGLIDFATVSPVPDVALEEETGVADVSADDYLVGCRRTTIALGFADADRIEKDS